MRGCPSECCKSGQKTRNPEIIECDAGLAKVVVPIFVNDEFIGVAGGCGFLQKGGEIDSFLINKTTGIGVVEIENLSDDIATVSIAKLESVIKYSEEELESIKHDFRNQRKERSIKNMHSINKLIRRTFDQ
jgi:ligand-binding sensor protein